MKKTLIIIPTYNELSNIQKLINQLRSTYPSIDLLIVDDNSPDGTGKTVTELSESDSQIKLIEREGKLGLGTAYVRGFKYVIENKYDLAIQMDADFSHDPKEIKQFLKHIKENDVVIGSRYIKGVNVVNWPMSRLLLSYFANIYTKVITGMPICDATGGYKCWRREVLESINLDKITSNGYSFQIEMNFKAWKKGFKLKEIPITFVDRTDGSSKMSKKIVHEAIFMVWKLRFASMFKTLD
ncbi:dolichol-phosphate mannosyltransferase [hydrocarbon metagenome]|uniref:Dolichol-phosphate mannosyltransferase n=1 Tax=hydrocarbon metagenome TaxID=938273 RepID=A0A0W8FWJ4_9ZZZZ